MRSGILLTSFLLILITSCQSSDTLAFKESLDRLERKAFEIVLGKEGPGEAKLKCLKKDDYKGALAAVEKQSQEFDRLIADLENLSAKDISKGEPLKTASLEYYQSLKELHAFDGKEIKQQALLRTLKDNELKNTHTKLIALAKQKKILYTAAYKKEALLHTAAEAFKTANGF